MTKVAVTGAAGNVGRVAIDALDGHDVTAFTHSEHDDLDSELLEIEDREATAAALAGYDVVVHLAANPSPEAEWDAVSGPNVEGAFNVYEAARAGGVERVVFASTNHVVAGYNHGDPAAVESMRADARAVHADEPPRPDSYYGVTKVAGEALGTYYADRHGVEVVNLRIGWLLAEDELREVAASADEERARFARAMWLSPRDCRDAIQRSVDADLRENPTTVHVVSRNAERTLAITVTQRALGYRPQDDAAEVLS
jgi:L-arabinose 1-dehydrogenase [NAD(P)+]